MPLSDFNTKIKNSPGENIMSDRFLAHQVHNPCPICGDNKGNCYSVQHKRVILCAKKPTPAFGEPPEGYLYRKLSENERWGVYGAAGDFDFQDISRSTRTEDCLKYTDYMGAVVEETYKYTYTDDDADNYYKIYEYETSSFEEESAWIVEECAKNYSLKDSHKEELLRRGLTEEQIMDSKFFSIPSTNDPIGFFPARWDGPQDGFPSSSGYAIPCFNKEGVPVGFQIKVDDASSGKYKWLWNGLSRLGNTELPLSVNLVRPINDTPVYSDPYFVKEKGSLDLYLTEGILKPRIAHYKHGINTLGASGGSFKNAWQQVTSLVLNLKAENTQVRLVLTPDGGDISNPQVLARIKRQLDWFKKFKLPIVVAWWGQFTKSCGDIDEIENLDGIQYLTVEEFFSLAKVWDRQCDRRKFTPDLVINTPYLTKATEEFNVAAIHKVVGVKSGMGTNKTGFILDSVHGDGIVLLGYRNSLLRNTAGRAAQKGLKLLHITDAIATGYNKIPSSNFALCVNSLLSLPNNLPSTKTIVIDEAVSVHKHLLTSRTIAYQDYNPILQKLTQLLRESFKIILLDGALNDEVVDYFAKLAKKPTYKIENTFVRPAPIVTILDGVLKESKINPNKRDISPVVDSVCTEIEQGRPTAIFSDSQTLLETLEKVFVNKYSEKKGLRIDSKTTPLEEIQFALANPDKYFTDNKLDYLLVSTSGESGLDISVKDYFKTAHYLFYGVVDSDTVMQMIGRIRDDSCQRLVWANPYVRASNKIGGLSDRHLRRELHLERILTEVRSTTDEFFPTVQELQDYIKAVTTESQDIHNREAMNLLADREYDRQNFRNCVLVSLALAGYTIKKSTVVETDDLKTLVGTVKDCKEEIVEKNATDIFTAADVEPTPLVDAVWEKRCEQTKAILKAQLPEIENSPVWSQEFVKEVLYKSPELISKLTVWYFLNNLDISAKLAGKKHLNIAAALKEGKKVRLSNEQSQHLLASALQKVGLLEVINAKPPEGFTKDSPEIVNLIKNCKRKANQRAIGKTMGKHVLCYVKSLLTLVGCKWNVKQKKRNKEVLTFHFVDTSLLEEPFSVEILNALDKKYRAMVAPLKPLALQTDFDNSTETALAETDNIEPVVQAEVLTEDLNKSAASAVECFDLEAPDWWISFEQDGISTTACDLGTLSDFVALTGLEVDKEFAREAQTRGFARIALKGKVGWLRHQYKDIAEFNFNYNQADIESLFEAPPVLNSRE
jgi:hypothetical protein